MTNPGIHSRLPLLILAALLATVATTHFLALDSGHRWWGDFSLYMTHAKNIVESQPYAATNIIVNPDVAGFSPPSYPPVYPLLLAPLYKYFGLDLFPPKVLNLAFFIVSLFIFYWYFAGKLSSWVSATGVTAALAFSPWFWELKNIINSDLPFVFFLLTTLIVADRFSALPRQSRYYWLTAFALGVLTYLSYGTRSLGLLLIPALVLHDLLTKRTIRPGTLLAIAVFALLHQLQSHLLDINVDSSYVSDAVTMSTDDSGSASTSTIEIIVGVVSGFAENIRPNLTLYAGVLLNHWWNNISSAFMIFMTITTGLLALTGFTRSCFKNISVTTVYFVIYICALIVVPVNQDYRYMLPVLPFYLVYIFIGAEYLADQLTTSRIFRQIPLVVIVLIGLTYTGKYFFSEEAPVYESITDAEAIELYDYIRNNTPVDSHIKFAEPRILALFTDRNSSVYNFNYESLNEIWAEFRRAGATHLLVYNKNVEWAEFANNRRLTHKFEKYLQPVFTSGHFALYTIKP